MQQNPTESPSKLTYASVVTSPAKPKARTPSPGAFKAVIKIPAMGRLIQGKAKQPLGETKETTPERKAKPQANPPALMSTPVLEPKETVQAIAPVTLNEQQIPSDDDTAPPTRKQAKKARAKARKALQMEATATTPTEASTDNETHTHTKKAHNTNEALSVDATASNILPIAATPAAPPSPLALPPSPPRFTAAEKGKNKTNPFTSEFTLKFTKTSTTESSTNKRKAEDSPPKPSSKKNTNEANPPLHTPKKLTIISATTPALAHTTDRMRTDDDQLPSKKPIPGNWYTMSGEKIIEPHDKTTHTPPPHQPPNHIPILSPTPLRIQPSVRDLERSLESHLSNIQAYTGTEKQYNETTMQLQESIVAAMTADRTLVESPMKIDNDPFEQLSPHRNNHSSRAQIPSSHKTPTPSARGSIFSHATSHRHHNPPRDFPNLLTNRGRNPLPQASSHSGDSSRDYTDRLQAASPMSYDSDNLSMIESEHWASSSHPGPTTNRRNHANTTHILSHNNPTRRNNQVEPPTPNRNRNNRTFTFNPFSPEPDVEDLPHDDALDPKETWTPADVPGILINGVGLQRTAEPPIGWHRPEFKIGPLHHLSDSSKADVARAPPHSIWLLPLRANNRALDELGMADTIRGLLDLLITSPHRSRRVGTTFMKANVGAKQESRFEYPYFILITGITPDQSELLLRYFCISTPNATFWTFPLNMPKSHFAGTVAGLHHTEEDIEEVREIITNHLLSNDHASLDHFVTSNSYPFNESAYRSLIANIHLSFVLINHNRNTTHRAWNLVLPTNNLNNQDTIAFLKLLNDVKFKTDGFGLGYFLSLNEIPMCEGCKSLGHYYHKCPYLEIEGWMGPKPSAPAATNQPHNWSEVYEHDHDKTTRTKSGGYQQRGNTRARASYRGGANSRGRGDSRRYR
ncbi:hypothetical protein H0H93_012064 [Arthromyces matolae]|nr:hypothetical protein H0H93_012064 [Arthromyces matolae]